METAHVAEHRTVPPGRRTLPPVPRPAAGEARDAGPRGAGHPSRPVQPLPSAAEPDADGPPKATPRRRAADGDAGQRFVARLRSAAPAFARAAGAVSAVVREAVPPARHRRARCRVVLRQADGTELDLTFLGATAGRRGHLPADFDELIQEWLRAGHPKQPHWLLADRDSADGTAIDLSTWRPGT